MLCIFYHKKKIFFEYQPCTIHTDFIQNFGNALTPSSLQLVHYILLRHTILEEIKIPWRRDRLPTPVFLGFSRGSDCKESACNAGDPGLIPGSGISLGGGNGNPLQYSSLENSMDKGAWWLQSMGSLRVGHD